MVKFFSGYSADPTGFSTKYNYIKRAESEFVRKRTIKIVSPYKDRF